MKRKRHNETNGRQHKKKFFMSSHKDSNEKDKTLYDYWKPARNESKIGRKSKSESKEKLNGIFDYPPVKNKYSLNTNPSKRLLEQVSIVHPPPDHKKVILINEDFLERLKKILEPFIFQIKNSYFNQQLNFDFSFKENLFDYETFDTFLEENLFFIYTKFLLQASENFIFIPNSFTNEKYPEKEKMKLLEGFNDFKHICLQYLPLNTKEVINDDFKMTIISYLKKFHKKMKRNQPQKALVLYDPSNDFIDQIKQIECVCNDMDYKIIRIDELEKQKGNRLSKISEATQSQRLSYLPEILNEKLKTLESVLNNDSMKLKYLFNKDTTTTTAYTFSYPTSCSSNNEDITHYFTQDTKERSIFNVIKNNICQICSRKKTLMLIVDTFSSCEENKTYLNSIINKISATKCPIAILTNNLNFAKLDNLFNNSAKTIASHFIFYQIECHQLKIQQKTIYLINIILFLHLFVKICLNPFMKINENDHNFTCNLLNEIYAQLDGNYLKQMIEKKIFTSLAEVSIKLSMKFNNRLESIFFYLSDQFRKYESQWGNEDIAGKSKFEQFIDLINSHDISSRNELQGIRSIAKKYDEKSYLSFIDDKIVSISNRKFNQFFFEKHYSYKINLNTTHKNSKDAMTFSAVKRTDEIVNCEEILISSFVKDKFEKALRMTLIEDKYFYKMMLINKVADITTKNLYEYNYLLLTLNNLDYESFLSFFGIRKPRSTKKIKKEKEVKTQTDEVKLGAFNKFFKNIALRQLERFYDVHQITGFFYYLKDNMYLQRNYYKYFTGFKIYEEIKNNENDNIESDSEMSAESDL